MRTRADLCRGREPGWSWLALAWKGESMDPAERTEALARGRNSVIGFCTSAVGRLMLAGKTGLREC